MLACPTAIGWFPKRGVGEGYQEGRRREKGKEKGKGERDTRREERTQEGKRGHKTEETAEGRGKERIIDGEVGRTQGRDYQEHISIFKFPHIPFLLKLAQKISTDISTNGDLRRMASKANNTISEHQDTYTAYFPKAKT